MKVSLQYYDIVRYGFRTIGRKVKLSKDKNDLLNEKSFSFYKRESTFFSFFRCLNFCLFDLLSFDLLFFRHIFSDVVLQI